LIGCAARIIQLTKQSLWLDEVFTLNVAQLTYTQIWNFATSGFDVHPPLFYWIEHFSISIFGLTPFALRIFPALFGVLTIPTFYLIGKELYANYFGLLLAFLLAISPFHIFHSQDARMYSLYLLIFSLSILFLLKYFNTTKLRWIIASAIALGIGCYIHFFACIISVIAIFFVILICSNIKSKRNKFLIPLKDAIIFILFTVLIIQPMIPTMIQTTLLNEENPFYINSQKDTAFTGIDVITRTFAQLSGSSLPLTMFIFITFLIGVYCIYKTYKKDFYLIFTPIFIVGLISLVSSYKIQIEPRYLIFMILPLFAISSIGLLKCYTVLRDRYYHVNPKLIATTFIILLILVHIPSISFHYTEFTKPDWHGVSHEISNITNDKNIVVLIPGGNQKLFETYYQNQNTVFINSLDELSKFKPDKNTIVLVPGDIKYDPYKPEYENWIKNNTNFLKKYDTFEIYKVK
jgi:uncharacterized membrane protein